METIPFEVVRRYCVKLL